MAKKKKLDDAALDSVNGGVALNSLAEKADMLAEKSNILAEKSNMMEQKTNLLEQKTNMLNQRVDELMERTDMLDKKFTTNKLFKIPFMQRLFGRKDTNIL